MNFPPAFPATGGAPKNPLKVSYNWLNVLLFFPFFLSTNVYLDLSVPSFPPLASLSPSFPQRCPNAQHYIQTECST